MTLTIKDGLLMDGDEPIAAVEDDNIFVFETEPSDEVKKAVFLLDRRAIVEVEELPSREPLKKRPKKKVARQAAKEDVVVPDFNGFDGMKDPAFVKKLHDANFKDFCKLYGVVPGTKQQIVDSIVVTDEEDLRYPARWTTCLTRKAYP